MATTQSGSDIKLLCQPANSLVLNVLDLCFFSAIQSLQDKKCTRNIDELISTVETSFEEYPPTKINRVFWSLQLCMKEVMQCEGSKRYKTPHINKAGLERNGNLLKQIDCDYI